MKGGAYVVKDQNLLKFLEKATEIKVLTDHSISCLTLKITGVPGTYKNKSFTVKKPQSANKSRGPEEGLLNESVDKDIDIETILVKLMPKKIPEGPVRASIKRNKRGYNDVAYGGRMTAVKESNFYEEIQTSINVYFSTLLGSIEENIYQEPVCPAILEYFWGNAEIIKKLRELKDGDKFKERVGIERKKPEITDQTIFENILKTEPAIIVMEFLEGYTTLDQYEREYYEGDSEKKIKKLNIELAVVDQSILDINRLIKLGSKNKEIKDKEAELVSQKTILNKELEELNKKEGQKEPVNKKALHYAYYCAVLYQIYRMTEYSKIRHQDLHLQNIMIKTTTDILDKEIEEGTIVEKIKSILNNPKFKINIKIIDYGDVEEETNIFSDLERMMEILFAKYNKVFGEDFMYAKFLSLTDISNILSEKDTLDIGEIKLEELKYHDIYKGSFEALTHIKEEYFKRFELLLQEAAPVRVDVATGSIIGQNKIAKEMKFVFTALHGEFHNANSAQCQTGTFRDCGDGNPTITMDNGGYIIKGTRTTNVGGGKKSKKNNKRKRKFRSKKNKK